MANSLLPTQIGSIASGLNSSDVFQPSKVVIGNNITGGFQAVGFGTNGSPSILQDLVINITTNQQYPTTSPIIIRINADDLSSITSNPNAPLDFVIKIKEVSICEVDDITNESVEKRMVVLASQTYLPPS